MLNQVLKYLNNYFFEYTNGTRSYSYSKDVTFTSSATMSADWTDTYIVGEYILVEGSRLNDGVYLISAIDATDITIDSTLDITVSTEPEVSVTVSKCYIPKELIDIIADIKTYESNSNPGISSESQGNRSVTYNGSSDWKTVYQSALSKYRKLGWC